jgi:hypothetical protein
MTVPLGDDEQGIATAAIQMHARRTFKRASAAVRSPPLRGAARHPRTREITSPFASKFRAESALVRSCVDSR